MEGADVVAEILRREGTEFIAAYPRNPLIEACAKIGIRSIFPRQERVGVGIADGVSRTTRGKRIGVFAAQAGPGIENSFPGAAQAYSEGVPVLIVTAGTTNGREAVSPVFNAVDNFRHVTKWATKVHDARFLPAILRRAYHMMRNGRPGPVLIEIGNEVWTQKFDGDIDYRPPERLRAEPDAAAVSKALAMLREAKNPIIWSGAGVLRAEASDELIELAELLNLPVMTTNPGKSSFPENHPLSLGGSAVNQPRPMTEYLRKADTVLAVGTSLTVSPFNPNMPAGKTVIHATNNAEDINKDYPAALGILGDAKLVLRGLVAAAKEAGIKKPNMRGDVREAKEAWLKEWAAHLDSDEVPINQYRIIRDLMKGVDRANTIITHDSGSPREQLLPFWETTAPGGYMGWGKSTQLGHGLGITMGAKLAAPDKLCINVMGDAAIGMVGMDLETAARNDIATLTIVFNNGVMAAERDHLKLSTEKWGTLTVSGNYYKLADALGMKSYRVEKAADFPQALTDAQKVVKSGKPALIECVVKQGYDFTHAR